MLSIHVLKLFLDDYDSYVTSIRPSIKDYTTKDKVAPPINNIYFQDQANI